MTERTPHPDRPAEGTDQTAHRDDAGAEETTDDPVGEDLLSKLPGGDSREVSDPPEADGGLGPDAHGPLP